MRNTPIEVTLDGVIWDGHHARIAAETGMLVKVKVLTVQWNPTASAIVDLQVGSRKH